ncbi:MAG TPA: hypothetical protein VL400_01795 [Polyangiaceae bacterium]|jgi:hypothetical protein|nr:hypothetical protein [Polyangiaceae bacterium]
MHQSSYGIADQGALTVQGMGVAPNGASVLAGRLAGAPLTVGSTTLTPNPNGAVLIRTDAAATPVDGVFFGGPNTDIAFSRAAFDSTGSLVLMGYWYGDGIDLGFGPLPQGGGQAFVIRPDW